MKLGLDFNGRSLHPFNCCLNIISTQIIKKVLSKIPFQEDDDDDDDKKSYFQYSYIYSVFQKKKAYIKVL